MNQPLSSLPVASVSRFSAIDAAFNSKLVGLHAALPLGDLVRRFTTQCGAIVARYCLPGFEMKPMITRSFATVLHDYVTSCVLFFPIVK